MNEIAEKRNVVHYSLLRGDAGVNEIVEKLGTDLVDILCLDDAVKQLSESDLSYKGIAEAFSVPRVTEMAEPPTCVWQTAFSLSSLHFGVPEGAQAERPR